MATENLPSVTIVATETPCVATENVATENLPSVTSVATETPCVATENVATENLPSVAIVATETPPPYIFVCIVSASTLPVLITGCVLIRTVLFLQKGDPNCTNPRLEWDLCYYLLVISLFLMAFIGVLYKAKIFQITCIILLLITSLSIFVTSWSVEHGGTFHKDPKRIEEAYRLESYAPWAQKFLLKDRGWNAFQKCLIERNICENLDKREFYQEGCCIPPPYCGYEEQNRTWVIPKTGRFAHNVNCVRWDSDKRKLCFDCETCQAVYIQTMDYNWSVRGVLLNLGIVILGACFVLTLVKYDISEGRANDNRSV